MFSNIFLRRLTSIRPVQNYQQHFLRLINTTESTTTANNTNDRQTGIVKRFSKDKGYGFISNNNDGTDCFVHFKNINTTGFKTLEQGQEVEFSVAQGQKGPEAKDVNIISPGTSRTGFMGGSGYNNSTSSRFGFGRGGSGKQSSSVFEFGGSTSADLHSDNDDLGSTEKMFSFGKGSTDSTTENLFSSRRTQNNRTREIGSVKRWTSERGFGFIRRNNGGSDLFCHVRSLKDGLQALEEGQTVMYRIQQTDKGEEARDVSIYNEAAGEQETSSATDSSERQTGTVKRWLSEKGYGFLRSNSGGSDVFVHLRELTEGLSSLEEGQTVEFNIRNSEKGDTAHNVTVQNEA